MYWVLCGIAGLSCGCKCADVCCWFSFLFHSLHSYGQGKIKYYCRGQRHPKYYKKVQNTCTEQAYGSLPCKYVGAM